LTREKERTTSATTNAGSARFVRMGPRDNFYQSAAFIPMSFALVTTISESGETGIGPHALCYPFSVTPPFAMFLISRGNSGTAVNLRRTGRCALNYVEFDRDLLKAIAALGYPGQPAEAKRSANPFTLVPSPGAHEGDFSSVPRIIAEAFQVIECTWDQTVDLGRESAVEEELGASRFVLRVDNILLRDTFQRGCVDGSTFPSMPIFYGFRAGGDFWFAEHGAPFPVAAPNPAGSEMQAVRYLATRLDEAVRFTDDACTELAKIPRPFLSTAMQRLIAEAKRNGRLQIDAAFMRQVRQERVQARDQT
jgi:flavin reductase (DIM6/NTAB) family NADH-FMN oxidoreductase RutF